MSVAVAVADVYGPASSPDLQVLIDIATKQRPVCTPHAIRRRPGRAANIRCHANPFGSPDWRDRRGHAQHLVPNR